MSAKESRRARELGITPAELRSHHGKKPYLFVDSAQRAVDRINAIQQTKVGAYICRFCQTIHVGRIGKRTRPRQGAVI